MTALPFQHVRLVRDVDFLAKLDAACRAGNSTFHATGVDPFVLSDRVLVGVTGLCNDITWIKLQENWHFNYPPPDTLALCGFGKLPKVSRAMPVGGIMADNFLRQVCLGIAEALAVMYSHVASEHEYAPAPQDLQTATTFIKADSMLPPGPEPNQYWVATIEGRPTAKMIVDIIASMETRERFVKIGGTRSEPGYHAVVASLLQAVPHIFAAPAGVLSHPL